MANDADANNMMAFFKSFNKQNSEPDDNVTENDYLDVPPPILDKKTSLIKDPKKASDFQINSILFIKSLNRIIVDKTITNKVSIKIVDDNKANVDTFISLTNEIIREMKTKEPYNQPYVFVYFLFFLYFMNFRVGQIFLYYIFFEIRKMSDVLSNTFQNYIQDSMSYSVVTLSDIVTDLSNNNYSKIKLPNTNVTVKYNPVPLPDIRFMENFQYKWNDSTTSEIGTGTSTIGTTAIGTTTLPKNDITQISINATKAAADAKANFDLATQKNKDDNQAKEYAKTEANNALKYAEQAKQEAMKAKDEYEEAVKLRGGKGNENRKYEQQIAKEKKKKEKHVKNRKMKISKKNKKMKQNKNERKKKKQEMIK